MHWVCPGLIRDAPFSYFTKLPTPYCFLWIALIWLQRLAHGVDSADGSITPRLQPKSISCGKTFRFVTQLFNLTLFRTYDGDVKSFHGRCCLRCCNAMFCNTDSVRTPVNAAQIWIQGPEQPNQSEFECCEVLARRIGKCLP